MSSSFAIALCNSIVYLIIKNPADSALTLGLAIFVSRLGRIGRDQTATAVLCCMIPGSQVQHQRNTSPHTSPHWLVARRRPRLLASTAVRGGSLEARGAGRSWPAPCLAWSHANAHPATVRHGNVQSGRCRCRRRARRTGHWNESTPVSCRGLHLSEIQSAKDSCNGHNGRRPVVCPLSYPTRGSCMLEARVGTWHVQ